MDISGLVQNEELFRLEILHPAKGEPMGITVMLRSAGSEAAMKVVRRQTDDAISRSQRKLDIDAEWAEKNEIEQAVSYVASWEWKGKNDWKGKKPECTPEMITEVFREAPWFYAQCVGGARKIANFTKG
jgi:hypothetical protein